MRTLPLFLLGALALSASPARGQLPADLELVMVQGGFSGITAIRAPDDGSGRLFVLEQSGAVRIRAGGTVLATPFIRLCSAAGDGCFVPAGGFSSGGERGLLGLAFHPGFPADPRVFLNYTDGGGDTVVASIQPAAANPDLADPDTFQQLLRIDQDFSNHNGGDIHFGPDDMLYIGMGDGGSGGDPCSRAQTSSPALLCNGSSNDGQPGCPANSSCGPASRGPSRALLGAMLRIDVDATTPAGSNNLCAATADGSAPYAVPANNPFAGDADHCGEIWAIGLRNPWRFSFDRRTGDMWIADVGQDTREEVNLEAAAAPGGLNYGWRCREGTFVRSTSAPVCNAPPALIDPVFDYARAGGRCSITGGYRYRGPAPGLDGLYFFGDFCQGRVLVASDSGNGWDFVTWSADSIGNIRTFGEDPAGNLYVGTSETVFLITGDTTDPDRIFADGFEALPNGKGHGG
jgi:glucose/arabinose dehydrogenase